MMWGVRISKQDRVFSKLVRERAGWRCEKCHKQYEAHSPGLHCSHIYSRRAVSTRWLPLNAVAHCYGCHMWFGGNPILGAEWAKEYLGAQAVMDLKRRFHRIVKLTKADKEEIYANLKSEYDRMLFLRANGKVGRINFESPYPQTVPREPARMG